MIRVWDPLVRVFHWSLVTAFAVAYVSAEGLQSVHEIAGYVAAGLVIFRILWGLVGPRYARFTQFVRSPSAVISYLRSMAAGTEPRYIGHNPAGGAMILALLLFMLGAVATGLMIGEPVRDFRAIKGIHELFVNGLVILVIAHVGGVIVASMKHGENLARAMVTGMKRPAEPGDID